MSLSLKRSRAALDNAADVVTVQCQNDATLQRWETWLATLKPEGMYPGYARQLIEFLQLKGSYDTATAAKARLSPSGLLDQLWHKAILETEEYGPVCNDVAGRTIHHTATNGTGSDAEASAALRRFCTYNAYVDKHGQPPPSAWYWLPCKAAGNTTFQVKVYRTQATRNITGPCNGRLEDLPALLPIKGGEAPRCIFISTTDRAQLPSNTLLCDCVGGVTMLQPSGTLLGNRNSAAVAVALLPPGGGSIVPLAVDSGTLLYAVLLHAWQPSWGCKLQDVMPPESLWQRITTNTTIQLGVLPPARMNITCVLGATTVAITVPPDGTWGDAIAELRRDCDVDPLLESFAVPAFWVEGSTTRQLVRLAAVELSLYDLGLRATGPATIKLHAVASNSSMGGPFQFFVKTFTGRTITLSMYADETVASLKLLIQDKEGIPPCRQSLMSGCKLLEELNTLRNYNVQRESTMFLSCRLGGC